jgi:hypothetical protein
MVCRPILLAAGPRRVIRATPLPVAPPVPPWRHLPERGLEWKPIILAQTLIVLLSGRPNRNRCRSGRPDRLDGAQQALTRRSQQRCVRGPWLIPSRRFRRNSRPHSQHPPSSLAVTPESFAELPDERLQGFPPGRIGIGDRAGAVAGILMVDPRDSTTPQRLRYVQLHHLLGHEPRRRRATASPRLARDFAFAPLGHLPATRCAPQAWVPLSEECPVPKRLLTRSSLVRPESCEKREAQ